MNARQRLVLALALALVGLFGRAAVAQEEESLVRLGLRTRTFLEQLAHRETDAGIDEFLSGSPLLKDADQVQRLREEIRGSLIRYGEFLRVEPLKIERVGQSLVRCLYLYHCEDYPVVWRVMFYRPNEDQPWVVIALKYDLDYDRLPATAN